VTGTVDEHPRYDRSHKAIPGRVAAYHVRRHSFATSAFLLDIYDELFSGATLV
jgi:hypothetical protein